jgi:hypothetical protein
MGKIQTAYFRSLRMALDTVASIKEVASEFSRMLPKLLGALKESKSALFGELIAFLHDIISTMPIRS